MAEALNAAVRRAARTRRIPKNARCAVCGFAHPAALEAWGNRWRCYECANIARGQPLVEAHHILGRKVHAKTVNVMANLHRVLSDKQLGIPAGLQERARANPLVFALLDLRAHRDTAEAMAGCDSAVIVWLQRLNDVLEAKFGKDWPTQLGLPPLFPEAGE